MKKWSPFFEQALRGNDEFVSYHTDKILLVRKTNKDYSASQVKFL